MPISRMSEPIFQRLSAIVREPAMGRDHGIERGLGVEVVGGLDDVEPGQRREPGAGLAGVLAGAALIPVPTAVPPSGTASSSAWAARRPPDRLLDLAGVAAEFLAEPDRRRVLEVRPAGLDDRPKLVGLRDERRLGAVSRAGSRSSSIAIAADKLHRGRDRVVRGLAAIDVVVRVDAPAAAEPVRGARWATTSFMFVFVDVPEPVW